MTPSIGVAIYPDDGLESSALLRNADHALYQAKDGGGNTFSYDNRNIHTNAIEMLEMEIMLGVPSTIAINVSPRQFRNTNIIQ